MYVPSRQTQWKKRSTRRPRPVLSPRFLRWTWRSQRSRVSLLLQKGKRRVESLTASKQPKKISLLLKRGNLQRKYIQRWIQVMFMSRIIVTAKFISSCDFVEMTCGSMMWILTTLRQQWEQRQQRSWGGSRASRSTRTQRALWSRRKPLRGERVMWCYKTRRASGGFRSYCYWHGCNVTDNHNLNHSESYHPN